MPGVFRRRPLRWGSRYSLYATRPNGRRRSRRVLRASSARGLRLSSRPGCSSWTTTVNTSAWRGPRDRTDRSRTRAPVPRAAAATSSDFRSCRRPDRLIRRLRREDRHMSDAIAYLLVAWPLLSAVVGVVFLVSGIDDLFIDICYLVRVLYKRLFVAPRYPALREQELRARPEEPIAVMIPACHESSGIPRM